MNESDLRNWFADVRLCLHINLGQWCDRNCIYRSDFSNFMKGKKFFTPVYQLDNMRIDILNNIYDFIELEKGA